MPDRIRRPVLACALAVAAAVGCGAERPAVETRVFTAAERGGDPAADAWVVDASVVRGALVRWSLRLRSLADLWGRGATSAPEPVLGGGGARFAPPATPEDLALQLRALEHGPIDELAGPAGRLREADPALLEPIARRLLRRRERPKSEYRTVLGLVGGDVPNRYGTFLLHWKKDHGYAVRVSEDWYGDLLRLAPARVGRPLRPVYRDCVETVALLWAVARIGRTDPGRADRAVEILLDAAYVHFGTFRDEVGRALRSMGDAAVPALVEASRPPPGKPRDRAGEVAHRKAAYAAIQLDLLDRGHPQRAIAAFAERPAALARLVRAYGVRKAPEAAEGLVDLADHDDPRVRRAAREAVLAYVTGPPPKVRTRIVRLLGGLSEKRRAELDHRTRMALALRAALERVAPDAVEPACALRREDGTPDPDCLEQPRRHAKALFAAYDARRDARRAEILAALREEVDPATRRLALDRALVADPDLSAAPQVAAMLVADARALAGADPGEAARRLRRAAAYERPRDPEAARRLDAAAAKLEARLLAGADAGDLRAAGVPPPSGAKVREQALVGAAGVFLGLLCFGALGGRRRAVRT